MDSRNNDDTSDMSERRNEEAATGGTQNSEEPEGNTASVLQAFSSPKSPSPDENRRDEEKARTW